MSIKMLGIIFLSVPLLLFILVYVFSLARYEKNRFGIFITNHYPTIISIFALVMSYYSIWYNEMQSNKRPILNLKIDCNEFMNSPVGEDSLYNYRIYLTNEGNIDAHVTFFQIDLQGTYSSRYLNPETRFTIPLQSSRPVIKEMGHKLLDNFLLSKYIIMYESNNGNGDFLEGDTIFCK